jgi:TonB family protein
MEDLGWKINMGLKIGASGFAIVILLAASLFAQDQGTKPDNESQAAHKAQARQPHRIHVKENAQKAKLVNTVSPLYPPFLGKRVDGTVVLHVVIGKNGAVNSARYVSGPPNLINSAVKAVLQWQYEPTLVNGLAVEVDTTVSVVFPPPAKQEEPTANK